MDTSNFYSLWLQAVAVAGSVGVMLIGVWQVFVRLRVLEQNFSANSLKALGIVIFLPGLILLAILTDFKTETLSALLGTVAGYVLSNSEDNSKSPKQLEKPDESSIAS